MTALEEEAASTFWFLTWVEFGIGTVSIADFEERREVLYWLSRPADGGGLPDPRSPIEGEDRADLETQREARASDGSDRGSGSEPPIPDWLQLIPLGLRSRWCFTKDDDDFYPSVPHGHLERKNRAWPKLNPYTGRAYACKDVEEDRYRLRRDEMITLWNNRDFRRHALETIVWYSEAHPHYQFPVPFPQRLPRWRRR